MIRFNEFFASVFTQDNNSLPPAPSITDAAMHDIVFTTEKILKKLLALKITSSCGPDEIHPSILKRAAHSLAGPLCIIFNLSYSFSCLPTQWLIAHVTPIFKHAGSRLQVENYRPISLTSIVCKVFENIIKDEMMVHLVSNNLIHSNQHGFVPMRSTQSNLLYTINDWSIALDSKNNTDCIFIDFKKAFDSISHAKLLHKLHSFGFSSLTIKWIKSFLSGRTQRVKIGQPASLSPQINCTSGVPQGSVLGPLLFISFINDLFNICTFGKLVLYADDASLYAVVNNNNDASRLQDDLNNIFIWSQLWQLPLNIKKCSFMRIRSATNITTAYNIGGTQLQRVTQARVLGVTLCENLSNSIHCDNISSLGYRRAFLLLNSFHSSNLCTMISLYKTYVRPLLEYCTPAWSPHLLKDIDQIESVQRFFTRLLPGMSHLTYYARLNKLGLQPLELRRIHNDCIYLFNMLHNNVDLSFTDFFTFRSRVFLSQMSLRGNCLEIFIPKFHLDAREYAFVIRAARYWNVLPNVIVQCNTLHAFRNHLNNFDFAMFLRGRTVTRP